MTESVDSPLKANTEHEERLASLLKLITSGKIESLADLQSQLESPAEQTLVKRASLVSTFDQVVFDQAFQSSPPAVTFDQFVHNANVEEVPRTNRVFRVKDGARQVALQQWYNDFIKDPSVVESDLFTKLLSHYQKPDDLERLGLLALTDPKQAASTFNELFDAADKNFDLAKCNDILKVFEDRNLFLNDDLRNLKTEKQHYLNARNLFARDYYQTTFYYARTSVVESFADLLKPDAKPGEEWIFQLYAKGGMGKTMFVKWLLARHCVPNRIPIARLDFDFIHLPTAVRFPLLLLLAIAEQLSQQIPNSAFPSLLRTYFKFNTLLRPPDGTMDESRQATYTEFQNLEPYLRLELAGRFVNALEQSNIKGNVIIVFDTLEEMSLNRKPALVAVLNLLDQIHNDSKRVRLLLSGRYNLEDRLSKFRSDFSKHTITHELEPFTRDEARAFLKEKRSLTSTAIVSAIVKKCKIEFKPTQKKETKEAARPREGFNPFKLSLFADLYQQQEVKTVNDILSYPKTDIEYLIKRVVQRIKEPTVQWLLRYAAIPRQFTFEIFAKVLAYHLEQELIKNRELDQVNQKFPKGAEGFNNQKNWKDYKGARTLNLRAIWNNLRKYASGYSFISFDTGDDSAPRLQPEVTVPMRRLLEEQEIFPDLHRDLEKFFRQKASREPDPVQRAQQLSETIYHRFQREGTKASEYWHTQLESVASHRDPKVRRVIAEELLGKDYIDDSYEPIRNHKDVALVELKTLREAYLRAIEAAVSLTANMKISARPAVWDEISDRLAELQIFDRKHPKVRFERTIKLDSNLMRRLAFVLQQTRPNYKSAITLLRHAVSSTSSQQMEIALRLQLADALSLEDKPTCLAEYRKVLRLVRSTKYPPVPSSRVMLRIGQWYQKKRNFSLAQRTYRDVLVRADKENNPEVRLNALRYLSDIALELGHYAEALHLLDQVRKKSDTKGKKSLIDALLVSQIHGRSLYQPLEALAGIEPFFKTATTDRERAALTELQGDLYGKLMRFQESLDRLEESKNLWVKESSADSADRARILRIEVQLFEIGNLNEADYLLKVAEELNKKDFPDLYSSLKLLRCFWAYKTGNKKLLQKYWTNVVSDKQFASDTAIQIDILASGLALGLGDKRTIDRFCKLLASVDRLLRVPLLRSFELGDGPYHGTSAQTSRIERLLAVPLRGQDVIPYALRCASVLGWCGARPAAKRHLDRAAREAIRIGNSFAYQRILLVKDRFNLINPERDMLSTSNFLKDFAAYPVLCGAALAEQAHRYFYQSNFEACKSAIAASREKFPADSLPTHHLASLDYLEAQLAREQGDEKAAGEHFRAALAKFDKLGNKPELETLQKILPSVDRPIERDAKGLALQITGSENTLSFEFYQDDVFEKSTGMHSNTPQSLLPLIVAGIENRSDLYRLSQLLIDPKKFKDLAIFLGKILFEYGLDDPKSLKALFGDFNLVATSPALAKIPWEFSIYQNKSILSFLRYFYRSAAPRLKSTNNTRWLQLALNELSAAGLIVDGVMGVRTRTALNTLRKKNKSLTTLKGAALNSEIGNLLVKNKPKRNTRALIIRSDSKDKRTSSFLEWSYSDCYFNVQVINANDDLRAALKKHRPDVIHIESAFLAIPGSGEIYLDFDPDFDSSSNRAFSKTSSQPRVIADTPESQPFSPSLLNHVLASMPEKSLPPLVILDARGPGSPTEDMHQLFHRNVFASQLFEGGKVSAVLAIGLGTDFELYQEQRMNLISRLSNTENFGEIANSLRKPGKAINDTNRIATQGIALFTNEPWLTVLTPERR
jgi:tetratricopeptide (TPR) repeat protein